MPGKIPGNSRNSVKVYGLNRTFKESLRLEAQLTHFIDGNVVVQRDEGIYSGSWDEKVAEPQNS